MKELLKKSMAVLLAVLTMISVIAVAVPTEGILSDWIMEAEAALSNYDADKAAEYAKKYYSTYNEDYTNYKELGYGDCANFVSQCLVAGGLTTDTVWYKYSRAWRFAPLLKDYLVSQGATIIEKPTKEQIEKGDIIVNNWKWCTSKGGEDYGHIIICVDVINGVPWFCGHTSDSYSTYYGTDKYAVIKMNGTTPSTPIEETYLDLGAEFYSVIRHIDSGKVLNYDEDNFVRLRSETGSSRQVWKFTRQEDGSYAINSVHDGYALEIYLGGTDNKTPIAVNGDWDGYYQRWFILDSGDGYKFKSKHYSDLNKVIDVAANGSADGTAIELYDNKTWESQEFEIYTDNRYALSESILTVSPGNSATNTVFSWNRATATGDEGGYNLKIWRDYIFNGDMVDSRWGVSAGSVELLLPAGTYQAYVDSTNYYDIKRSNVVTFTVSEYTLEAPCLSVEVGTSATESIFTWNNVPEATSYDLKFWKTDDGSDSYYQIEWDTYSGVGVKLPSGTYDVYVDATNASTIKKSNTVSFTVPDAAYLSVTPGTPNTDTIFEWTDVNNAGSYDCKVWKDELWVGPAYSVSWNTSSGIDMKLPAGKYYAYVDTNLSDGSIVLGNVVEFTIEETLVDNPSMIVFSGSPITNTDFDWTEVTGAEEYLLCVWKEDQSGELLEAVSQTSTEASLLLPAGKYTAQVIASHEFNSTCSDPIEFEIEEVLESAPTLTVVPGTTSTETVFEWDLVEGAKYYDLFVYANLDDEEPYSMILDADSGDSLLLPAGTYYAKLYASHDFIGYGGDEVEFTVTDYVLTAPTNLYAYTFGYTSIKMTWNAVEGADGYEIFRCDRAGQPYYYIDEVSADETAYRNIGLSTGTTYYYKVRAFANLDDGTKLYSDFSAYSSARPLPATPVVTVTRTSATTATVSWVKIYGATGYSVYRSTEENGTYTFVANLKSGDTTTYKATGLASTTTYYYKVRAYRQMGDDMMFGSYSKPSAAFGAPATPVITARSVGYTSAKVVWEPVANADGYAIYRCDVGGGAYSYIASVDDDVTSYTNTGLSTGTTYYYKVRAYVNVENGKLYGNYSLCATARPIPATPVVTVTADSATTATVSWVRIYGATGYSVYRSTEKDGTYTFLAGIPSGDTVTYTDKNLDEGVTYYYKVRAYRQMGSDMMFSNYSLPVCAVQE